MNTDFKTRRIDRNDMLELTRRMTVSRNCMTRIAGCYVDETGMIENTFNVNFLKLKPAEKAENLSIAKTVPFGKTNEQTIEYCFPKKAFSGQTIWRMLSLIQGCGLKNDILMELLYENITVNYKASHPYAIDVFHGTYDVPVKGEDQVYTGESEETYDFIICTIGAVDQEYHVSKPDFGFLFPTFRDRSSDDRGIAVYHKDPDKIEEKLIRMLLEKTDD